MSRRRQLKKRQRRRTEQAELLEELYLRQDDDAFLAAAKTYAEEADEAFASMYREVADRALAGALTGGDLARLSELLTQIRPAAASPLLATRAMAADDLAHGRCGAAASLPDVSASEVATFGVGRRLPAMLRALAGGDRLPAVEGGDPLARDIDEAERLFGAVEGHAAGGGLPRRLAFADPAARAVWDLYRALVAVGARGGRPGAKTLTAAGQAAATAAREVPLDGTGTALLRAVAQHVQALEGLHKLGQSLRRRRAGGADEQLLAGLRRVPAFTAKLLREDPPSLLRPLHHALRGRWRDLLELVAERCGAAGLARLLAARPELLAADLEVDASSTGVEQWSEAETLAADERYGELAGFLRSQSARDGSAERRASLWSLELWALRQAAGAGERSGREAVNDHDVLLRLLAMARAVADGFAADQRQQVARFLRCELVELCEAIYFCGHVRSAAEALSEHLGDDAVLLALIHADAVLADHGQARSHHAARISDHGPAPADQEALVRLVASVAAEPPNRAVPILTAWRPLFDAGGWSQALDAMARVAVPEMRAGLIEAAAMNLDDAEEADWIAGEVGRDVERYRPLLGEHPQLLALDVALACRGASSAVARRNGFSLCRPARSADSSRFVVRRSVSRFLARLPRARGTAFCGVPALSIGRSRMPQLSKRSATVSALRIRFSQALSRASGAAAINST